MTSPDPLAALVGKWRERAADRAGASNTSAAIAGVYELCADELATALDASRVGVVPLSELESLMIEMVALARLLAEDQRPAAAPDADTKEGGAG